MPERMLQAKSANIFVTGSDSAKIVLIIGIILGVLAICAALFFILARYMRQTIRVHRSEEKYVKQEAKDSLDEKHQKL